MSEELQSGPVIIPLSAYNVGFGGGVSEEEVNELIENNLDIIKDQIDELSANASSIEGVTTNYETAIGYNAIGIMEGTAIGYCAKGSGQGTAIGYKANGTTGTVAIGHGAIACGSTPIVIKSNSVTLKVSNDGKLLVNDNEIGSGGLGSSIVGVTTYNGNTAIGYGADATCTGTAIGYCANGSYSGTAIGQFASGTTGTVAIGHGAIACGSTPIVIKSNSVTLKVSNDGKLLINDNEIGSGSCGSCGINLKSELNELPLVAIGAGASAVCGDTLNNYSVAIGFNAKAKSYNSIAIGSNATTNTSNTIAIGYYTNANCSYPIHIKARGNADLKVTDAGMLLINSNSVAFMSAVCALQNCIDGLKSRLNALETA